MKISSFFVAFLENTNFIICIFFEVSSITVYVLGINAIATGESYQLGLVATTASGVRLYFTTADNNTSNLRPHNLILQHVRLPPGFSGSSQSGRPSKVHMSYYQNGNFFIFIMIIRPSLCLQESQFLPLMLMSSVRRK